LTVIACNREYMASDTQTTEEMGSITPTKKIFRIPNGLIGLAGDCEPIDRYLKWELKGRKGRPPGIKNIDIIKLTNDGKIITRYSRQIETEVDADYYAIGCGAQAAMAILNQGGTPKEAVKAANKVNIYCSGLQVERL